MTRLILISTDTIIINGEEYSGEEIRDIVEKWVCFTNSQLFNEWQEAGEMYD